MFVVTVTFQIEPGQEDHFLKLVCAQASNTLTLEKECHQFDVCVDRQDPSKIFLYEIYENEAAFTTHLASDHFIQFDKDCTSIVRDKSVSILTRTHS